MHLCHKIDSPMNLDLRDIKCAYKLNLLALRIDKKFIFSNKVRGLEVSIVSSHAAGPGSIPGQGKFLLLKTYLHSKYGRKKMSNLLVIRLADMATPDAADREVRGSNPVPRSVGSINF